MPVAEFEEKAFEGPLNAQLLAGSPYLFTPGQVLESVVGFDAAMLTQHAGFWSLWNLPPAYGGTPQSGWWHSTPRLPLPGRFRLNLFLQYKRPHYLTRPNSTEWKTWKQPYFRYRTVPHQQSALDACAQRLGGSGLVVYASPAFATYAALFRQTMSNGLVSATNFVEATQLSKHGVYTYAAAGKNNGFAFSEPTAIESLSLEQKLPELVNEAPPLSNNRNIFELANLAITDALEVTPAILGDNRQEFEQVVRSASSDVLRRLDTMEGAELVAPYLRVTCFTWLTGWHWLVGAASSETGE